MSIKDLIGILLKLKNLNALGQNYGKLYLLLQTWSFFIHFVKKIQQRIGLVLTLQIQFTTIMVFERHFINWEDNIGYDLLIGMKMEKNHLSHGELKKKIIH